MANKLVTYKYCSYILSFPEYYGKSLLRESELPYKVVYLDQNCWIDLARLCYHRQTERESELVDKIFEASEKYKVIFPLSISHLEETMKISSARRKNELVPLMIRLSRGYSFQPSVSINIRAEIQNIVLRKLGLPQINVRNLILKQGISNLIGGGKPTLVSREGSELPEGIQRELLDLLESPKVLEFSFKLKLPKSLLNMNESIEVFEKNRQLLAKIKDKNMRHRAFLAWNMRAIIVPELAKILYESGLPKDFFLKEKSTRKDIEGLLDSIPTALCLLTLIYKRDQQLQRPIQTNDFHDIWFLTLALPYSDIVATEKMWASISRQTKLDRKCNTKTVSSIKELGKYLSIF